MRRGRRQNHSGPFREGCRRALNEIPKDNVIVILLARLARALLRSDRSGQVKLLLQPFHQ